MQNNYNNTRSGLIKNTTDFKPFFTENAEAREQTLNKTFSSNQIIDSLPVDECNRFLNFADYVNHSAGENIYQCGEAVKYIYFPITSVFSQYQILEDGRTCEISLTGREGCVGLSSVLTKNSGNYWTEVIVGGTAMRISSEIFNREFTNGSILRAKISEYAGSYIEQLSQRLICNFFHSIKERFCSRLLTLRHQCHHDTFSFTQEAFARALGVHRPSLSCVAKELEQQEIISYTRGRITVRNWKELKESACTCF